MKKTILFLIMAAGLMGCAKELTPASEENPTGRPVTFEINVQQTKAAKTAWADGDVIYVFFKGLEDKYLELTYDGSSWTNTAVGSFSSTDFDAVTKTLTAVHFPVKVDVDYADKKFSFTKDGEPVYNYYLAETEVAYTVEGTTVSASLALGKPEGVAQFHVAGIDGSVADYTFGSSLVQPVACASVSTAGAINEEALQAGARLSGIADSDGAVFGGRLTTTASADYTFTLASNDKIYTLNRPGKALEGGKMYNFPALDAADWSVQNASDLVVDLGLPSGLKWATWNVGATTKTEYGDYFAWGETAPKTDYRWDSYFDTSNGGKSFEKYALDKKIELGPEDDAAYAALGGKFRMPTDAEWTELRTECTWDWKTTDDGYAANGYLVTGPNKKTIFLPAAGLRYDSSTSDAGSIGYYWSSSLYEDRSDYAWLLDFGSSSVGRGGSYRFLGFSVRPVSE